MDKLSKQPNETELAYHKRLIFGKLVDGTLADEDYSELAPYVYGKEYSSDVARRMMYGSRRTLELLDEQAVKQITSDDILSELDHFRQKAILDLVPKKTQTFITAVEDQFPPSLKGQKMEIQQGRVYLR